MRRSPLEGGGVWFAHARQSVNLPTSEYHACHGYVSAWNAPSRPRQASAPLTEEAGAIWMFEDTLRATRKGAQQWGNFLEFSKTDAPTRLSYAEKFRDIREPTCGAHRYGPSHPKGFVRQIPFPAFSVHSESIFWHRSRQKVQVHELKCESHPPPKPHILNEHTLPLCHGHPLSRKASYGRRRG